MAETKLPLDGEAREAIIVEQHRVHTKYWAELNSLRVPILVVRLQNAMRSGPPPPPQEPYRLCGILGLYACELFDIEFKQYPYQSPALITGLADRIEEMIMEEIARGENLADGTLAYPVTKDQMRLAIRESLRGRAAPRPSEATKPKRKRLPATVTSKSAARRMEEFLKSNGIGQTEFAIRIGATDRTLRNFRKTGTVRRDIFGRIAEKMGLSREALLR